MALLTWAARSPAPTVTPSASQATCPATKTGFDPVAIDTCR
ncbi:hypothetical protein [Nonomuraea rhodomycinica]|nr:hypothetical protein [Nonomuraea rhodomycinica]